MTFETYDNSIDSHGLTAINEFDGYLWSVGGYKFTAPHGTKVWRSRDGVAWSEHSSLPEERVAANLEVFNGFMWLIGGFELYDIVFSSEIYKSRDGTSWETVALPGSSGHVTNSYVFNHQIYLVVRATSSPELHLYRSGDGSTWQRVRGTFPIRNLNRIVELNHRLYAFTNGNLNRDGTVSRDNEIWSSLNGIDWAKLSLPPVYISPRSNYSVAVYRRKIWIVGGWDGWFERYNDIWSFNELEGWKRYTPRSRPPFSALHGHSAIAYKHKLWLFHGYGEEGLPTNLNFNLEN